jgi:YQGE family putative transporter
MQIHVLTPVAILQAGVIMGIANGFFWANRQFLVLTTTTDERRNYYYGFELFFATLASVVVPFLVGWFISGTTHYGWMGGVPNRAYLVVASLVLLLCTLASYLVIRGNFTSPRIGSFFYWKFSPVWWQMLLLANFKGLAQGYILAMPAIMVMLFVGQEGTLGVIESVGGVLTAVILYLIGRLTTPTHRGTVFAAGLALFAVGSLLNTFLFDVAGVLGFQICLVVSKPMLDLAYWPIELKAIDHESRRTGRDRYAYLMSHEFGLLHGRMIGCGLMLVLAVCVSGAIALRFAMPVIALAQMLSIPVYGWLKRGIGAQECGSS